MKIAIVGCAHGELQNIYDNIEFLQEKDGIKVDVLICCGDFQASRNKEDLLCMAVPAKYQKICTFYKYVIPTLNWYGAFFETSIFFILFTKLTYLSKQFCWMYFGTNILILIDS